MWAAKCSGFNCKAFTDFGGAFSGFIFLDSECRTYGYEEASVLCLLWERKNVTSAGNPAWVCMEDGEAS